MPPILQNLRYNVSPTAMVVALLMACGVALVVLLAVTTVNRASVSCGDNDKEVCAFLTKWAQTTAYRVTVSESVLGDTAVTRVVSIDGGRQMHISSGTAAYPYDAVLSSTTAYIKDASQGGWWRQTVSATTMGAYKDTFKYLPSAPDGAKDGQLKYKKIGTSPCGTARCYKYQVDNVKETDSTTMVLFSVNDHRLRRIEQTTQRSFSEYDFAYDGLVIPAPSPAKSVPAGQSLVLGSNTLQPAAQ